MMTLLAWAIGIPLVIFVGLFFVNRWLALGFAALAAGFAIWCFWIEPRSLQINELSVEVASLETPIRIAAIGDPQPIQPHWSPARLREAFQKAKAADPDIVLWLGDYAYDDWIYDDLGIGDWVYVDPAEVVEAMASIDAPMGSYAVLGNHDWWWDGAEVARLIEQTHINLLIDRAVLAKHPETGAALWIAGLDDISTPRPTDLNGVLQATDQTAPTVVLSHSPDIFPRIPEGPALTLSGHTHCGQVYIPFVGRPIVPILNKQYTCGFFDEGGRKLFVTSGIGSAIFPMRFMTPPEIAIIDLVPET